MKLKLLAAAVAMIAATGAAQAAITNGTGGSSEFVFSAWDSVAGKGYTADLNWGVDLNGFIGADTATNIFPTGAVTATPASGGTFYNQALSGFASFMAGLNPANVVWNLTAVDSAGRARVLTGMPAAPSAIQNSQVKNAAGAFDIYTGAVDGKGATVGSPNGYTLTTAADLTAYAGNTTWAQNFGTKAGGSFNNAGMLGGQENLYLFFQKSTSQLSQPGGVVSLAYQGQQVFAKTYQDQSGNYSLQIAAVPEPSVYAMLLAGLGMLGFMVRRRLGN